GLTAWASRRHRAYAASAPRGRIARPAHVTRRWPPVRSRDMARPLEVGDMIGRSGQAVLAAVLLLAIPMPLAAQDATSSVAFDGAGFSFDRSLGRSVTILSVRAQRPGRAQVGEASPSHIAFALYPRQREARRVPGVFDVPGTVRFYRTSALADYP